MMMTDVNDCRCCRSCRGAVVVVVVVVAVGNTNQVSSSIVVVVVVVDAAAGKILCLAQCRKCCVFVRSFVRGVRRMNEVSLHPHRVQCNAGHQSLRTTSAVCVCCSLRLREIERTRLKQAATASRKF